MVKFYKSIARYYDDIFPLNVQQVNFVVSLINGEVKNKNVLDVGCGTGNLSLVLAKYFNRVEAIDLDPEMISIALSKAAAPGSNVNFRCLNMLEIINHFSPEEFDLILSFGNTVVHLDNVIEIGHFLDQTKKLLKPGGKLLLQIVNYDHILEQYIHALPMINNNKVKFDRYYDYFPEKNKINFTTILTVKESKTVIKNRVLLYPLKQSEVKNLLNQAGYRDLIFYGSFTKETFNSHSLPMIVVANKTIQRYNSKG